jgi:hypothetical protein
VTLARPVRRKLTLALLAPLVAGVASAATLDDLLIRQKNGMWELRPPNGSLLRFCMTEKSKRDARAQMLAAMQGMGCRYLTDRVQGDRFEVVARCASSDPSVGTFEVRATGTASAERWQFAAKLSGGGPMVQTLASNPAWSGTVQWRRLGACKPGAAPGLQPR